MTLLQKSLGSFVWSKVGTETGQTIGDILCRKEIERQANGGTFTWGIGNSLGPSIAEFMQAQPSDNRKVIFTPMKSAPKKQDEEPGDTILLWRGYYGKNGGKKELPPYSFLISRFKKGKHYALLCRSDENITAQSHGRLNSKRLVNYRTGNIVGGSQVTAVVKDTDNASEKEDDYAIQFVSSLYDEGQVALADSVEIDSSVSDAIMQAAKEKDLELWKKLIERAKN